MQIPGVVKRIRDLLGGRLRETWPQWLRHVRRRILNANVPVVKGYIVLFALLVMGLTAWLAGQFVKEQQLLQALAEAPDNIGNYADLFSAYRPWQLKRGHATFVHLAEQYPDKFIAPFYLAVLDRDYLLTNVELRNQKVLESLDIARQRYPKDEPGSMPTFASLYLELDAFEKAEEVARALLEIDPQSDWAHYYLGRSRLGIGDAEGAQEAFEACRVANNLEQFDSILCQRELLPATRTLTMTLSADHVVVTTAARIDDPPATVMEALTKGHVASEARSLVWGNTAAARGLVALFPIPAEMSVTQDSITIVDGGLTLPYSGVWYQRYDADENPTVSVKNLPLAAYTSPLTVTVVAEGVEIVGSNFPYSTANNDRLTWFAPDSIPAGKALELNVRVDQINRLKLIPATDPRWHIFTSIFFWSFPAFWSLIVFVQIRRTQSVSGQDSRASLIQQLFHSTSLFSWLFDAALVLIICVIVVFRPVYAVVNYPYFAYSRFSPPYLAYNLLLALLVLRLMLHQWYVSKKVDVWYVHIGAIIFTAYMIPRMLNDFTIVPFVLIMSALAYYSLVVRRRSRDEALDWKRFSQVYASERYTIVERIDRVEQAERLTQSLPIQEAALASGKITASEYKEARALLENILEKRQQEAAELREKLGVPDHVPLKAVLFRMGPQNSPLKNSLMSVFFGLVPYILFLALAAASGDLWEYYGGTLDLYGFYYLLVDLAGVPWGPFYLFFFGYFYHTISGDYGAIKGFLFGMALSMLSNLFEWLWLWNQVDIIDMWGNTLRILVTFVFVGVMMDWMTSGFSWRKVRLSYDSPASASVLAIVGTTVTTVITAILTGTLSQLLSVSLQGTFAAFGIDVNLPR